MAEIEVSLLGVDVAGILGRTIPALAATLKKTTAGARTPGDLSAGINPTQVSHDARGFVEDYRDGRIDGTIIRRGDRRVTLLGATISDGAVPEPNDSVVIEGREYVVVAVTRDPAGATYALQVR